MKSVRVRMYRQGLGDCFLLSFPKPDGESHVLIDCGVLKGTEDAKARMVRVAESIRSTTGGCLDVLVVTHEHWDHVSGFLQAESVFNQFTVREVWLAWTEDPTDDLASTLAVVRRQSAATALEQATIRLAATDDPAARRSEQRLRALLGFFGDMGISGRATTAAAMKWVKQRNANVRYFRPNCEPVRIPDIDYAQVYVLGPPRDPKMLRKSNPSARSSEVYELADLNGSDLGLLDALAPVERGVRPFDDWFRITEAEAWDWEDDFFGAHYGFEDDDDLGWRRIEADWIGAADRLALQLDSHTNNTSLALAFEVAPSNRVLLFPGDAQIGNWLSWFKCQWSVDSDANTRNITVEDLLARTVLYKVGHHGSHNATLRDRGLDLMTSRELTAMLPVDRLTARKMDWNMPFPALHRRLEERTRGRVLDLQTGLPEAIRSDRALDSEWESFLRRTNVQQYWIDYHVEL